MAVTTPDKIKILEGTWGEILETEKKVQGLFKEVQSVASKLERKYKLVTSVFNEDYTAEEFIQEFDSSSNSLFYCLNPFESYTALIFIPSEKSTDMLIPVQVTLVEPEEGQTNHNILLRFAPQFLPNKLEERNLSITDVLVRMTDLIKPIEDENIKILKEFFDSPPPPEEGNEEDFDNLVNQRLFEALKQERFKKQGASDDKVSAVPAPERSKILSS